MKHLVSWLVCVLWLSNVVYAFVFWGFLHGIANVFIPYAIIADIIVKFGRIG